MQRVARKKSSVDVNLLAAAEDSSMEEENEAVSIGDNSIKQKNQGDSPSIEGLPSFGEDPEEGSDDETFEFPRASKYEVYDMTGHGTMDPAGGPSSGRLTAVAAQEHKAAIPLLGKPKVRCYDVSHATANYHRWTNNNRIKLKRSAHALKAKHDPGAVEDTNLKRKNVSSTEDTVSACGGRNVTDFCTVF